MIDVSSQNTKRVSSPSERTSPSMAPANATQEARHPPDRPLVGEVADRVGEDEDADTGDEQPHQEGEPVEAQVEVETDLRHPPHGLDDGLTVEHGAGLGAQPHEADERRHGRDAERPAPGMLARREADESCDEM